MADERISFFSFKAPKEFRAQPLTDADYAQLQAMFGPAQPMRLPSQDPNAERLPDGTLAPTEFLINADGECEDNWFELNNPWDFR